MDLYFSGVLKEFNKDNHNSLLHNISEGDVLLCRIVEEELESKEYIDVIAQHIPDGSPSTQIIISRCKITINSIFDNVKFYCNETLENVLRNFATDITNYEMSELIATNSPEDAPNCDELLNKILKKDGPFDTYIEEIIDKAPFDDMDGKLSRNTLRERKKERSDSFEKDRITTEESKMSPEEKAEFCRMMNKKLGACNRDSESEEDDDDEEDSKPNDNYHDYDPFGPHTVGEILGIT